jgi:hypothetical protein
MILVAGEWVVGGGGWWLVVVGGGKMATDIVLVVVVVASSSSAWSVGFAKNVSPPKRWIIVLNVAPNHWLPHPPRQR